MNILIVSSFLPYPLHSGGQVRLYNLMKYLARNHSLTLVCEIRANQTEQDISEVKKLCKEVYTVPRNKQWTFPHILEAGFTSLPFLMVGHRHPQMREILKKLLEEKSYDVIHVETFYINHNLPVTNIPVVLAEHNVEYHVYERYIDTLPPLFIPLKLLLHIDIWKMKRWEKHFWKSATKLIAVSEHDKKQMERKDTVVIANGVDVDNFQYQISNSKYQKEEKTILFIGDFKWIQNVDAARQIISEVWPHLQLKINPSADGSNIKVDFKLWIVGRKIPSSIRNLAKDEQIIFDETVDDTAAAFQKADVLLAPIRVGGGTKFKILEAMASGVPVVTTKYGAEGLNIKHSEHMLIGETNQELADLLIELFRDEKVYKEMSRKARTHIEDYFSWEHIAQDLEKVYKQVVTN